MRERKTNAPILSEVDQCFLKMVHDPSLRGDLLARLQELELLDAFLQAERETN